MGWLCVLGWQMSSASAAYVAATEIQGLVVLNYSSYVYEQWHGTLLTIAVAAFAAVFNITLARKLPMIEAVILIVHICAFFGIIVPLWVLAPRTSAKEVFTVFSDGGGWGSLGTSALAGITAGASEYHPNVIVHFESEDATNVNSEVPLIGADAVVHMSEEIHDAGRNIPRSMITTTIVNGVLGKPSCPCFSYLWNSASLI